MGVFTDRSELITIENFEMNWEEILKRAISAMPRTKRLYGPE
jgi:hypothetical protein